MHRFSNNAPPDGLFTGEKDLNNRNDWTQFKVHAVIHSVVGHDKSILATQICGDDRWIRGLNQIEKVYKNNDVKSKVKVVYVDNVVKFKPELDKLWEKYYGKDTPKPCKSASHLWTHNSY